MTTPRKTTPRRDRIDELTADVLDLLVVGGGIVGAGIARDAAMRGLRVGLVEQHDLAFGTSSRSSRLLHGGLRYLAQGRIGLVREAGREKRVLHHIAPHLADPLPFVFPTYRGTSWPLWQLRIGVKLYDFLCGGRNLGPSSSMKPRELLEYLPGANPHNLTGGVRYFDGLTNDARLVIDTLRSAAEHGATGREGHGATGREGRCSVVCNYTRLESASPCAAGWECELRDVPADRTLRVTSHCLVNAAGPWADALPHSRVRLRLTKGVHLVIDRERLPIPEAVVMARQRRILFAIPWGSRVILGTTDTDYSGAIEAVRTESGDVRYILEVVNAAFPHARLAAGDLIGTWAGLRPLLASRRGGPSDVSRAHQISMPQPGWLDVAGGKLTTYRLIARQAVDRLLRHLQEKGSGPFCAKHAAGRSGKRVLTPFPRCRTAVEPLLPPQQTAGISGILPPPPSVELVEHYCNHEWAVHLADVMIRRTSWHYYRTDADRLAEQVSGWMADAMGWDAAQQAAELARYRQLERRPPTDE